ncbi:EAL domain-containing protein [Cellulomonas endophytica]|uniref:EAL domain-containing protein n=1 Tax=Cellulomonas endophytica TaxID=2494735 RepID=UPI001F0CAE99|nr:EAL domain-containing protein [Cellulomonas endophytica]
MTWTPPTLPGLRAAVDDAVPRPLRQVWEAHVARTPAVVGRQGIFRADGRPYGYQLSYRSSVHELGDPTGWGPLQHEHATRHVLDASFGRRDLDGVADGRLLFVRCPRPFLVGDLSLPPRPDRLVVEVPDHELDGETVRGIRRLRAEGFRIAVRSFIGSRAQRPLLPHADFVRLDVRDLDVEGHPVVEVARSCGALLVAEFVETATHLALAREMGFPLLQGNLLQGATTLDRSGAPLEPQTP